MNYLLCTFRPITTIENCGYAILPPGWIHPDRKLPTSVLILGHKGNVFIEEEDTTLEIRPNRLVLLIANRHHQGKLRIDSTSSYYWLHFNHPAKPELLTDKDITLIFNNPLIIKQRLSSFALLPQQMDIPKTENIYHLFHELLNEQEEPSNVAWKFQLLFQELLVAVTEAFIDSHIPSATHSRSTNFVYSIISYIANNFTDPNLSLKYIAYKFRYNPDYIGRKFKEIMKLSIGEYILQQRINTAVRFLQETDDTVTSITRRCGFLSVRHFLRQFKRVKGMTPTELRYRYKAIHINMH